jgi:hypothetical protein
MKTIFTIFAIAVAVIWFAANGVQNAPDEGSPEQLLTIGNRRHQPAHEHLPDTLATSAVKDSSQAGAAIAVQTSKLDSAQASELVSQAIRRLDTQQSVSANLRLRIRLFDADLIGAGLYQQAGQGSGRRFRFELKTQTTDQVIGQIQVCDGESLWRYRWSAGQPHISRLNLTRVRQARERLASETQATAADDLASGGLAAVLRQLSRTFRPLSAEAGYLNDAPVWAVDLAWNSAALATLAPEQRERLDAGEPLDFTRLPQLPERGVVFLGYEDLFPRRIEFRRRTDADGEAGQGGDGDRTVVSAEFHDVRFNEPVDPRQFQYQPGGAVEDITSQFLQQHGLLPAG